MMTAVELVSKQRKFFNTFATRSLQFRRAQLNKLYDSIKAYEPQLYEAFEKDLHKHPSEVYTTEIGITLKSITDTKKKLRKELRPRKEKTPLYLFGAKSYTLLEPYGVMLIISPFNYPFQLALEPLIGAIATGNTAIVKTSELTPNVSAVIANMIAHTFPTDYITVVEGEVEVTTELLEQRFDYIFFTGSPRVGQIVMEAAAKHLTPVTLELGGKSPAIVTKEVDIADAATKIAWGKLMNAGQTCIAPDYLLIEESQKESFMICYQEAIRQFYGPNPLNSSSYGRIVSPKQTTRLIDLLKQTSGNIIVGGACDTDDRYIAPTVVEGVSWDDALMSEELFGPILPIITFDADHFEQQVIEPIQAREKPLALYLFTADKTLAREVFTKLSFGGGVLNDVLLHISNPNLPFGGVGHSGIGRYHGRYSFEEFSHRKAIVKQSNWLNTARFLYPPYNDSKRSLMKLFLK